MKVKRKWSKIKSKAHKKNLPLQYRENEEDYKVWFTEGNTEYYCIIFRTDGDPDCTDFEDNYKDISNSAVRPLSADGKEIVRAESRPLGTTTIFTNRGDNTDIGNGKELFWDFSKSDDLIDMPSGSAVKRKRIEFSFLDSTWMKEGTIYFHNAKKGSYIDFYVVCPTGYYYADNDGVVKQATEDTPIVHYGIHIHMQGNCPMGDELNTESCSNEIPAGYKFWLEVTVPNADNDSNGYVTLELYRKRSVIL